MSFLICYPSYYIIEYDFWNKKFFHSNFPIYSQLEEVNISEVMKI